MGQKLLHTIASGADGVGPTPAARVFTDTEDHELIQRRLGLFYGILGMSTLAMYVAGLVFMPIFWPARFWEVHLSAGKILHLAIVVVLLGTSRACRGRLRSSFLLSIADLFGPAEVVIAFGVMMNLAPPGVPIELLLMGPVVLVCVLRAALVPSPPRWTLLVTALGALPAPALSWFVVRNDPAWNVVVPRETVPVIMSVWCIITVVASYAIARVVYGLRAEVKRATRLGQYTLEDKIGEGGMGVVYRARHSLLRRPTAIKLLAPDRTGATDIRRFEREVQLTSSLTHPNTIAIYDFGHTRDGVFYYAMEHLDGVSLSDLVENEGPQEPARVVHILRQIAGALGEAHSVGMIHRDVKPANIFLCERGGMKDFVKVLDFGLVKEMASSGENDKKEVALSRADAIAGTPHYMAPESITSPSDVDARVDIYALGGVAYFLLTGTTPFDGNNLVEICSHHLHTPVERPSLRVKKDLPAALEDVVLACLAKSPKDRPKTARDVIEKLDACVP
jgi:eukaryotic-like serine/threonine-protein kinase